MVSTGFLVLFVLVYLYLTSLVARSIMCIPAKRYFNGATLVVPMGASSSDSSGSDP